MRINTLIGAMSVALAMTGLVQAADWGDLTIQFQLSGKAPAAKAIKADKDVEVCGKHKLVDESLVVGPNGGIANVFVYLKSEKPVAVHPDYEKASSTEVVLDNKGCRFEPQAAFLWTKQTLLLKNSDPVGHNTKIEFLSNPPINPILPANGALKQTVKKEERMPTSVSCSIHPWMQALVLVRENPYGGVTNEEGKLTIKNVPAGKWQFAVWHKRTGWIREASDASGKAVKWPKTGPEFTVKAGGTDLGVFKIDAGAFKE